jgi:hypothetical protein
MNEGVTREDVAREFPGWHLWTGVGGVRYARRRKSVPAVVVRGEDWAAVREKITDELAPRP